MVSFILLERLTQQPTSGPRHQPACPSASRASSATGLPPRPSTWLRRSHRGPAAAEKAGQEAVQGSDLLPSRHKSPACHLARTPARAPAERSPRLGSSWELPSRFGGTSLAVPIAQHAAVLTQKQIKTADSTGLHMCPFCKPTGTPSCPAATFADTAGALCILRARGILFWLEAPVNPVPRPLLGPRFRVLEGFAHGDEQAILKNSLKNKTETL